MLSRQEQNLFCSLIHFDSLQFLVPVLIQFLVVQNDLVNDHALIVFLLNPFDIAQPGVYEGVIRVLRSGRISHFSMLKLNYKCLTSLILNFEKGAKLLPSQIINSEARQFQTVLKFKTTFITVNNWFEFKMSLRPHNNSNHQTFSAYHNENNYKYNQQNEALKIKIERHQQLLSDIIRELKQKVNKSQFLSGLGSKVSLSDITNISFETNHRDDSLKLDQSFCKISHQFQEKLARQKKIMQDELQSFRQNTNLELKRMRQQLQKQYQQSKASIQQLKAIMRQQNQGLLQIIEKKGDRSELDKIMHLTSLLAIQFQLIKKRFSNFQVDYNLIWKEISNIYSAQQGLKSVFETEQKQNSFNNTLEKDILRPLKKRRNSACVANLFKQLLGTVQKQQKQIEVIEENSLDGLQNLRKQLQLLKNQSQTRNYSLNIFNDKLIAIQEKHGHLQHHFNQLSQMKKEFQTAKKDIENIYEDYKQWKKETQQYISTQISKQIQSKNYQIKAQIKQACQEISQKMLQAFEECAKEDEIVSLQEHIRNFQRKFVQQTDHLQYLTKKLKQDFGVKSDYLQDKIKLIQKDVSQRLKTTQFQAQKSALVTTKEANNLIKKVQCSFKKDLQVYQQQQKEINELLCSQNVVARWIWISGELKGGNLVSWDKEVINTLPQNFTYLKNQYCIKVKSTGIYRFEIGFYAKKKPTIQIIVNGQTIISAVNSNSYVVHHSSGRLKDISTTQVTGLTYYDFFTFAEESRISIAYNGEIGHGFISLQRL